MTAAADGNTLLFEGGDYCHVHKYDVVMNPEVRRPNRTGGDLEVDG